MELEIVNKLYLELSQFASAETARERMLREALENQKRDECKWRQIGNGVFRTACDRVADEMPGVPGRDFKFCPWCGMQVCRSTPTPDHD